MDKGLKLDAGFRADVLAENAVIIGIKFVERILPMHERQVLTSLRLSGIQVGLLMNFQASRLADGLRRFVV